MSKYDDAPKPIQRTTLFPPLPSPTMIELHDHYLLLNAMYHEFVKDERNIDMAFNTDADIQNMSQDEYEKWFEAEFGFNFEINEFCVRIITEHCKEYYPAIYDKFFDEYGRLHIPSK